MTLIVLYACVGAGLAATALGIAGLRQTIDHLAERLGFSPVYARLIWLGGTIVAWPIGLVVLTTGRLVLVDGESGLAAQAGRGSRSAAIPAHLALRSSLKD
ncbi:MAG: hypothetical protein ACR2RA_01655 [Geminicoccaceae bacterium]